MEISWAEFPKFHIIDARLCFGIWVCYCVCVGGPSHSSHTPLGFVLFGDFFLDCTMGFMMNMSHHLSPPIWENILFGNV